MTRWATIIVLTLIGSVAGLAVLGWLTLGSPGLPRFSGPGVDLVFVWLLVFMVLLTSVLWALGFSLYGRSRGLRQSNIILTYLEQAVRLNLPLPRMLLAAEASEPRWIGRRIGTLRQQINSGAAISDALRKAVPGTSYRTVALIRAAEQMGQIGPELHRAVLQQRSRYNRNGAQRAFLRSYPVAMSIVVAVIVSVLMVFVVPRYIRIFRDFRVELPPLTQEVIGFVNFFEPQVWLLLGLSIGVVFSAGRLIINRSGWRGPLGWFTTHRDLADVCHLIASALEAGDPLDAAIDRAATVSISSILRKKLRRWANGIVSGMSSADAARSAGLPPLICGLTTSAEGFAFLSRYYESRFSRLMLLVRASAIPAMVFGFGLIVGTVALALFLPIIALINSV